MKLAGVDFGTTLVKVFITRDSDFFHFPLLRTFPRDNPNALVDHLQLQDVTHISATGIAIPETLPPFALIPPDGDPIQREFHLQANGARKILSTEFAKQPTTFLLASIGTGTSYVLVTPDAVQPFPFGSGFGGGYIRGFGTSIGIAGCQDIERMASLGTPPDILLKEILPQKTGMLEGEFIIAHFGRAPYTQTSTHQANLMASAMRLVAANIVKDIAMIGMVPPFNETSQVVFIGSTIPTFPTLRKFLEQYCALLGKQPYFLEDGAYAGAIGAYYAAMSKFEQLVVAPTKTPR